MKQYFFKPYRNDKAAEVADEKGLMRMSEFIFRKEELVMKIMCRLMKKKLLNF